MSALPVEVRVRGTAGRTLRAYVVAADDGRLLLRRNQTAHQLTTAYGPSLSGPYTLPGPRARNGTPHPTGA